MCGGVYTKVYERVYPKVYDSVYMEVCEARCAPLRPIHANP